MPRKYEYTFTVYKDSRKQWRWRLTAPNGKIFADSGEGYRRRVDCLRAIRKLRQLAGVANIESA